LGCCFTYIRMKVHIWTMVVKWGRWQRQCDISKNNVGKDTVNFLYINPYKRLVWKKMRNLKLRGSWIGAITTNNK
jgi:hypothetical protein